MVPETIHYNRKKAHNYSGIEYIFNITTIYF